MSPKTKSRSIKLFQRKLLSWYAKNKRDLPWRRTQDPYKILVSEIMLQQTQVDRVTSKYVEFLKKFPTFRALARSSRREVVLLWSGLGYNRRALNLHEAAKAVVRDHHGKLPASREELLKLKGIGPYTVGAILSFAFRQDAPALDTNIRRVLHRVFFGSEFPNRKMNDVQLEKFAAKVIPKGKGYDWNHALMDFGALQCSSRRPQCETCPLQETCKAYPKILTDVKMGRKGTDRMEPAPSSTPHIPNRIFRGRAVAVLRTAPRHTLSFDALARTTKVDYTEDDEQWFFDILLGLEQDGLVRFRQRDGKVRISLAQ